MLGVIVAFFAAAGVITVAVCMLSSQQNGSQVLSEKAAADQNRITTNSASKYVARDSSSREGAGLSLSNNPTAD
jgi:hypothetical protein